MRMELKRAPGKMQMFPVSIKGQETGFTVLELVVVVALISLVLSVAPSIHGSLIPSYELRQLANDIANESRVARQRARVSGAPGALVISADSRSVVIDDVAFELPNEVSVTMTADEAFGEIAENRIGFFSTGVNSGGVVTLTRDNLSVEIEYSWISGAIEVVQ